MNYDEDENVDVGEEESLDEPQEDSDDFDSEYEESDLERYS